MRAFDHKDKLDFFKGMHSLSGFLPQSLVKVWFRLLFYSGFALLPPLIMVRRVFLDRRIRLLVMSVLILAAGMAIEIYLLPHYGGSPIHVVFLASCRVAFS